MAYDRAQLKVDTTYGKDVGLHSTDPSQVNTNLYVFNSNTNEVVLFDFSTLFGVDNICMQHVHEIGGTQTYLNHKVKSFIVTGGYIYSSTKFIPNNRTWILCVSLDSTDVWVFDVSPKVQNLTVQEDEMYHYTDTDDYKNPVTSSVYVEHSDSPNATLMTFKTIKQEDQDGNIYFDTKCYGCYSAPMDVVINKWHAACYDGTRMYVHGGYDASGNISDELIVFPDVKNNPSSYTIINTGIPLAKHDIIQVPYNNSLYMAGGWYQDDNTVNQFLYAYSLDTSSYTIVKNSDNSTDWTNPYPSIGPILSLYKTADIKIYINGGLNPADGTSIMHHQLQLTLNESTDRTVVSSMTDYTTGKYGALVSKCYTHDFNVENGAGYVYFGGGPFCNYNSSGTYYDEGKTAYAYGYSTYTGMSVMTQDGTLYNYNNFGGRSFLATETNSISSSDVYIIYFTDQVSSGELAWTIKEYEWSDQTVVDIANYENGDPWYSPMSRIAICIDPAYAIIPRCYNSADGTFDGWTAWKAVAQVKEGIQPSYNDFFTKSILSNTISRLDVMNNKLSQYQFDFRPAYGQRVVQVDDKKFVVFGGTYTKFTGGYYNGFDGFPLVDQTYMDMYTNATPQIRQVLPNFADEIKLLEYGTVYACSDTTIIETVSNSRWNIKDITYGNLQNPGKGALVSYFNPGEAFDFLMLFFYPVSTLNLEIWWNDGGWQHIDFNNVSRPFLIDLRPYAGTLNFTTDWYIVSYGNIREHYGQQRRFFKFTLV